MSSHRNTTTSSFGLAEQLLYGIEEELQRRIEALLEVNENYREIVCFLENIEQEMKEVDDECFVGLKTTTIPAKSSDNWDAGTGRDHPPPAPFKTNTCDTVMLQNPPDIIVSSQLDDILLKAKAIRERDRSGSSSSSQGSAQSLNNKYNKLQIAASARAKATSSSSMKTGNAARKSAKANTSSSSNSSGSSLGETKALSRSDDNLVTGSGSTGTETSSSTSSARASSGSSSLVMCAVDFYLKAELLQHHPLEMIVPSRSLYLAQAHLLSQLQPSQSSPSFPPSALFATFTKHYEAGPFPPPPEMPLEMHARYIRKIRGKYEKGFQNKLNRLGSGYQELDRNISEDELRDICVMWWDVSNCIAAYEQEDPKSLEVKVNVEDSSSLTCVVDEYSSVNDLQRMGLVDSSSSDFAAGARVQSRCLSSPSLTHPPEDDVTRLQNLAFDLVGGIPLYSREDFATSVPLTLARCSVISSRVCYAVETILSKLMVRSVLQEMKECVALSLTLSASDDRAYELRSEMLANNLEAGELGRDVNLASASASSQKKILLDRKWVEALRLYQATYRMLITTESAARSSGRHSQQRPMRKENVFFFKKSF